MGVVLDDYQIDALRKMKNGCILNGGVGCGKSRISLAYYFLQQGGELHPYKCMNKPKDLYIITTARKRDTYEWEGEMVPFLLSTCKDKNTYDNNVVVDSWNNIKKYVEIKNAFFIFDEQRVVGYGTWTKSFLKIASNNNWILLSATPGDCWMDYIPVFIANGFYKNKTDFTRRHVVWNVRNRNFPQVDHYVDDAHLLKLKRSILIDVEYKTPTIKHNIDIEVEYNKIAYKDLMKVRWNHDKNKPIETAAELCYELRKICNSDESRSEEVLRIVEEKKHVIIFYNFDYELEILKTIDYGPWVKVAEWNGHIHEPIPNTYDWVYLVQYSAGAEGWNCITTDTIIFYSQNYSYKTMVQAAGRIDRRNTSYSDLYFYHLKSKSNIDLAIDRALKNKKKFNEKKFAGF